MFCSPPQADVCVCCTADSSFRTGPEGETVSYYGPCISDMFMWNVQQQSSSSNKQGMICPGLSVNRHHNITDLSADYYDNVVSSDPLLYSYQGCACAPPLVAYYHVDSAGMLPTYIHKDRQEWPSAATTVCPIPISNLCVTALPTAQLVP